MSKQEIPKEMQNKLESFHVEVPDISAEISRLERIANWIHAPAKSPLDILSIRGNSMVRLIFYPLIFFLVIFFTPVFFI